MADSDYDSTFDVDGCAQSLGFAEDGAGICDFRDLRVWRIGMDMAKAVYQDTKSFPREEVYGLTSQMRRAAVSIPANIAEGYGRNTTGAYANHLRVAMGSTKELETLIELSASLGFLSSASATNLIRSTQTVARMLHSLITSIDRKRR